ncbi:MAG: UbiX family flavin prenyltransferase [Promethearchaeota archaeon]|nr:MAG: UbiX family flavin prenyltransferase [Candidatus Lokiarchaeota archaeon]
MVLIAITGATGIHIAIKLLEILKEMGLERELIISKSAEEVIKLETNYDLSQIRNLASKNYDFNDLTAAPASGSYKIENGMIIVPCTMKTLSAIANGYADNLITRAADVMIKEQRKLVLVVRESPLSAIHLENMLKLARLGVVIAPPVPSYYIEPKSVNDLIIYTVGRILDQINIHIEMNRWGSN